MNRISVYSAVAVYFYTIVGTGLTGRGRSDSESDISSHGKTESFVNHLSGQTVKHELMSNNSISEMLGTHTDTTLPMDLIKDTICSDTWFLSKPSSNGSTSCECGSELGGVVECHNSSKEVDLLDCYCMTFSTNGTMLVVGPCIYGCKGNSASYYPLSSNASLLTEFCSQYHREGQLCGKCENGFALPAYSYNLACVECSYHYPKNVLKYVAVSFLPLTLFFIVIVALRVRVTSGVMNVFVLISQVLSAPTLGRLHKLQYQSGDRTLVYIESAISSLFGIWNLDFFRLLYPSFCLHPKMTTVQILALDYAIAVYPLALLTVAYLLVKLHDSDFKLIVYFWRPFQRCFIHFRRDWNIKTSLIDAFATFLLLSYVKFLSVSFDLLAPVHISNIYGQTLSKWYLYWDGTIEYFGNKHLPYAILALVVAIVFNILPLLLLCLYPSRRFQTCLHQCRLQNQILHTFMDAFQGWYKDGTNGSHDCRWFAGLYLFIRILFLTMTTVIPTSALVFPIYGFIVLILLLLTVSFRPYKLHTHNRADIFMLFLFLYIAISGMASAISKSQTSFDMFVRWMAGLSMLSPLLYILGVILYSLFAHQRCIQNLCKTFSAKVPCRCTVREDEDYERLLPERMVNVEECAALLADPMQVRYTS